MSSEETSSSGGLEGGFPTYKTKSIYPSSVPTATIYFDGIELFCFDGDRECTVAINAMLPDHMLDFGVAKEGGTGLLVSDLPDGARDIRIVVENPVEEGVYVYAPDSSSSTPDDVRYSFVEYTVDAESPSYHDTILPKRSYALTPRFHINNGLFFGYKLSSMYFKTKRENYERPIGQIALALGADIFVKTSSSGAGGSIKFFADDSKTPFFDTGTIKDGDRYEIKITNTTAACAHHVDHVNVGDPIDFRFNYEAINIDPSDRFLILDAADPTYPVITLGEFIKTKMGTDHYLCDGHPCLGVICGRTRQLPDPGD